MKDRAFSLNNCPFSSKHRALTSIAQAFSLKVGAKSENNRDFNSKDGVQNAIDEAFCGNNGASSTDLP